MCKEERQPRRTVDVQAINAYATRETPYTEALPPSEIGTTGNEEDGVRRLEWLPCRATPPCDKHFTTFITPWGRYRYCSAPEGYVASSDGFTRRFDEIIAHIPNKTKYVQLMIPYCGQTALTRPSGRQCSGWTLVAVMALRRTLITLCSVKTLSSLPDLKYHSRRSNHARRCYNR